MLSGELIKVYEESDEGIVIIDKDAIIVYCNDLWIELCAFDRYGYSKDSLIGTDLSYLVSSGVGVKAVALSVLKDKKKITSLAYSLDRKAILTMASPIFDENGELEYVVAFVKDESEIQNLKSSIENYEEIQNMYIEYLYHGTERQNDLVVNDPKVKKLYAKALKISTTDATVLINGESGTGKDVLANFIHNSSRRNKGPFIAVNCGAIPENLVESEFFGYERGAFTGANKEGKKGIFEAASKGTLFLDEISELPLSMQVKLLRVIETRSITHVGGVTPINVDVRIIAATNVDLLSKVRSGEFRQDLYYRINVIRLTPPPLRERKSDLEDLISLFQKQFDEKYLRNTSVTSSALKLLKEYTWPGNIRELKNVMENLVLTSIDGVIDRDDVAFLIYENSPAQMELPGLVTVHGIGNIKDVVEETERQLLQMAAMGKHSSKAIADELGIDQTTALRKLKKYNINYK